MYCIGFLFINLNCKKSTPTEKECINVHMHIVKIIADDPKIPEEEKALILRSILNPKLSGANIDSCMKSKSRKQIECEMKATSFFELSQCKKNEGELK
ncbi:MAG: LipL41-expression chaperone Lep [Leptospiraceae bacterium]|nr:LipL41-expression chaperone Lep [Leptospiraceae bacterium]